MISTVAALMAQPDKLRPAHHGGAAAVALLLFALPGAHPLLHPFVGVPSHLLWFVHVLPVGLISHAFGVRGAAAALALSAASVALGEQLFGQGYGQPADAATIVALTAAVTATGALVAGFALLVRSVERQRVLLEEQSRRSRTLAELGTVIASIAHELNNPLAAVATYADVVRSAEVPPQLRADVEVMAHEAGRAAGIARQLLRLVRDGERPREVMTINRVVERVLRARAPSLAAHRIAVRTRLASELPAVAGVGDELEQVLTNLVTNAEHAMHEARQGGHLDVTTRQDGERVLVEVADDGPGIRPEHLPRLFDAFFTTKPVGSGTGLGLSIARRIARAHGGDLTVHSEPGRGATFTLALPAVVGTGIKVAVSTPAVPAFRAPLRVLVVDDEPAIRGAVERLLGHHGHSVRTAGDSLEALATLTSDTFDAVVCDPHLGGLSGTDLYRDAVTFESSLEGRFVFITGDLLDPGLREQLEHRGCRYLAKPFDTNDLLAALQDVSRAAPPALQAS